MKSTRLYASLAAVSLIYSVEGCSKSKDDDGRNPRDSGPGEVGSSGGSSANGGSGGETGGKASGGNANAGGGGAAMKDGGNAPATGGSSTEGGASDAGNGGNAESGAGGTTTMCQANLQNDPDNCGRCGKSCGGGDCIQGLCEAMLVLDAQESPYGPTLNELSTFVDQGKIYEWLYTTTNATHYVLQTAPTTPASTVSKGTSIQDVPNDPTIDAVAFDSVYVYEAVEGDPGAQGQVARKKLDGSENEGAATKLFSLPADLVWKNIAVTPTVIYLTGKTKLNGPTHPDPDTTAFYRITMPVANATAAPTTITGLAGRNELVTDLTVIGTHLFWLEYDLPTSDYFVYTAPTTGGPAVQLGDGNTSESSFTSDGTYVYWSEINDAGRLMRCPLANLDMVHAKAVTEIASAREGIFAKGQYVYVMELPDPRPLYRVNTSNGDRELLGNVEPTPSEKGTRVIGVDSDFVYMTSIDAKVWRLPNTP
jgi:hypothetical protein